jgi:hypothetical protein
MRVRRHDRGRFFPEAPRRACDLQIHRFPAGFHLTRAVGSPIARTVTLNPPPARTAPGG